MPFFTVNNAIIILLLGACQFFFHPVTASKKLVKPVKLFSKVPHNTDASLVPLLDNSQIKVPSQNYDVVQAQQLYLDIMFGNDSFSKDYPSYNQNLLPMADNKPVDVEVTPMLQDVLEVDMVQEAMRAYYLIKFSWRDHRLAWDPLKYGNINSRTPGEVIYP